mmetsp:Transcript_14912/g.34612  ORF Transcript_14912/g.34612 Transcript_14912/m.34612 type:complete len:355 (-) Transcript_14912:145-1209(-)|eukprot:CAMPEP_0197174122 /NCGR_PEP_ID=MMETSP1423-20130617/783_1 /TAXON_ID=476441 /ORGANISM="Pseudo-nitzschia heimii, Strain UNC1101" /LENGTH=354 /DNA_ID=CAMNT_0042623019 /DNA_START=9 /DNA_END=1073 /DNA_ORIENTATION=+
MTMVLATMSVMKLFGGNVLRVKSFHRWLGLSVGGEKSQLSHYFSCCGVTYPKYNRNPIHHPKKQRYDYWINKKQIKFRDQTRATVSYVNDEYDQTKRYRYRLYKYKICPFSNIARVFLEYQMIPFESVEVNPLTKVELGFSKMYRKVPIVTILDTASTTPSARAIQQLNGTEEILSHDYEHFVDHDNEFFSSESSIQWQHFARKRLAPLLYPNVCRTIEESFRAFEYVHSGANHFSALQRYSIQYIGSVAMYFAASKIKEKYNINDVQVALKETLVELDTELSKQECKFLRPCSEVPHLGDLAVFGVLKGLEGMPLWNELFGNEVSAPKYPDIQRWYASVDNAIMIRKLDGSIS